MTDYGKGNIELILLWGPNCEKGNVLLTLLINCGPRLGFVKQIKQKWFLLFG